LRIKLLNRTLLTLSGLLFATLLIADPDDVFIQRLENASGVEKGKLYNQLAGQILNENPDNAVEYANKALELAIEFEDQKLISESNYQIGNGYRLKGDNLKALDYYLKALNGFQAIDDKEGISKSSNKCGLVYRRMGDYSTALDYHMRSLRISREVNNTYGISESMIDVGIAYRNLGKSDIALDYYNKALETSPELKDVTIWVMANIAKGNIYWYEEDYNKALKYYKDALKYTRFEEYTGEEPAGIYNNLGNVYRQKEDFKTAFTYYDSSLFISERIGDKNQIAVTYKNIGIAHKMTGKYSKALEYFNRSRKLAETIRLIGVHREILEELSDTYARMGRYQQALKFYREYTDLKESLEAKATQDKISIMQLGYHLKDEAQRQTINEVDLNMKVLKERNIRNIIIFITLLSVVLIFVLWSRYKLKLKSNQELLALNADLEHRVEERTKRLREENDRRRVAQEHAEMANETKNRFLANISHEVRTPINAIIGFCDLTEKTNINDEQEANLQRIKDSSAHLLALIKDVMDYSQIETGKTVLKESSLNLKDLLKSVINAFYLDAKSKQIKMSSEIDPEIPENLKGDKDALQQILYNLVGNAVKFTEKGTIKASVSLLQEPDAENIIRLQFSVKDSGIGISRLKQKLIFMDFTQEYDTSTRKYGGAGLGLTISKHFIELMGGDIRVESEKGKGSNFIFEVNLKVDTTKSNHSEAREQSEKTSLNILIAEDNLLNAQVIVAFLNRLGHQSNVASNGLEALDKLAVEEYDAVLMDIEMPEMDGLDATRAIRKGEKDVKNPDIPVIALTAHALQDYEEKSYQAGMNSYLTKPVDINQLSEVLRNVTSKNGAPS
jgi:signal transduction histidine kinase/CheY-like chemotaxis protein